MIIPALKLSPGKHDDPGEGVCIMEVLSLALSADLVNGEWRMREGASFTDLPACTSHAVAHVAQRVWDATTTDEERLRLLARFLPRLLRAKRTKNWRVNVRVALAAARFVEQFGPAEAKACNDAVEAWLAGEASERDVREARDATHAAAHTAAYAAAYAATAAANATFAAHTAATIAGIAANAAANAANANVELLDHLLDAHAKALADEGEMMFDPEPWEADAIDFVDRLMAELGGVV